MNTNSHRSPRALIVPAAGMGTRSGLTFPKTLFSVNGIPILVTIIRSCVLSVDQIIVIASPKGETSIKKLLIDHELGHVDVVIQQSPTGMGDAVFLGVSHLLSKGLDLARWSTIVIWGDIFGLSQKTVRKSLEIFEEANVDFFFPTLFARDPYTLCIRNYEGSITEVIEQREIVDKERLMAISAIEIVEQLQADVGERDIGLFVFNAIESYKVFCKCRSQLKGEVTGEIGFLKLIRFLVEDGLRVKAEPIADPRDAKAFNTMDDLRG